MPFEPRLLDNIQSFMVDFNRQTDIQKKRSLANARLPGLMEQVRLDCHSYAREDLINNVKRLRDTITADHAKSWVDSKIRNLLEQQIKSLEDNNELINQVRGEINEVSAKLGEFHVQRSSGQDVNYYLMNRFPELIKKINRIEMFYNHPDLQGKITDLKNDIRGLNKSVLASYANQLDQLNTPRSQSYSQSQPSETMRARHQRMTSLRSMVKSATDAVTHTVSKLKR